VSTKTVVGSWIDIKESQKLISLRDLDTFQFDMFYSAVVLSSLLIPPFYFFNQGCHFLSVSSLVGIRQNLRI
jgi:hypothetical protein